MDKNQSTPSQLRIAQTGCGGEKADMARAGRKQRGGYSKKPMVSESEAAGFEGFLFLSTSSCLKWEMVTKPLSDYQRHPASWIKRTQRGSKESDPVCSIPVQPACTAWPCSGSWESIHLLRCLVPYLMPSYDLLFPRRLVLLLLLTLPHS